MRIYGDLTSGNCYKVKLVLNRLGIDHQWVPVSALTGETRSEEFLARNPNGRIPLLETAQGRYLPESNAIMHYLARGSSLLPEDPFEHAQVLQWLFFEQYSHEPYIAVSRFIIRFLGRPESHERVLDEKRAPGHAALRVMEQHLAERTFFVGERYSIADVGLYAYTHVAHEGGFDLTSYPAVRRWLEQVAAQPGYLAMDAALRQQERPL